MGARASTAVNGPAFVSASDARVRPQTKLLKCNVDASFSWVANKDAIGIYAFGMMVAISLEPKLVGTLITNVLLGETMSLFLAINWVRKLGYKDADCKLDAKFAVDAFNSKASLFAFGSLIKACKNIFLFSIVTRMLCLLRGMLTRLLILLWG